MQKLNILIVEENPHLCSLLAWHLQQVGHHVRTTDGVATGKVILQQDCIQLLLLDNDLSSASGLNFCTWVYRNLDIAILLLSSQGSESDIIDGLTAGADDYLTKPLSMKMLGARVQTLARRIHRSIPPTFLQYGDLKIDLVQRRVTLANQAIELTPQEFSLLFVLVQANSSPLSRSELLERAWPESIDNPRTVDTHILSLRKKIEADPRQPHLIQTVRNVGYCFAPGITAEEVLASTSNGKPAKPKKTRLPTTSEPARL